MSKNQVSPGRPSLRGMLIVAGLVVLATLVWLTLPPGAVRVGSSRAPLGKLQPETETSSQLKPAPVAASMPASPAEFQLRPFAVAQESRSHQWTRENGRELSVIRQLAHNGLEHQRLVEENARIQRRQLVYRKDTVAAVMQRARSSGERVEHLTLPGFDGQEYQFAIERADLEPSRQAGNFTGHLTGRPDSIVTLAFKFGREAFTILSPADSLFLQAHPREPGELIITSFDPEAYQPVPGGEPVITYQK